MLVRLRERRPVADFRGLERDIHRVFQGAFGFAPLTGASPVDVSTDADGVTVRVELPGIDPANVAVNIENGTLSINAERAAEQRTSGRYQLRERRYGSIAHTFRLADELDTGAVVADSRNGVLTVRIPKRAEAKPRQIPVTTN